MTDTPREMTAALLLGHGGLDRIAIRDDVRVPMPAPGEVLVRVGACGLNNTDINTRTAWYSSAVSEGISEEAGRAGFAGAKSAEGSWGNAALTFPRIQGADVAGTIVAVGDGIDPSRMEERVMIDPWLLASGDWMDPHRSGYFGSECDGGFAEYTKVRSENAIAVNSALSDAELATFPCAYTTAENLVGRTNLQPGETVVIAGASGGVGSAAIQLCRLRGARVIGIAASSKTEQLVALGVDAVIDRNTEDMETAIRTAADGPIDVALDVVGGAGVMPLLRALRQGGRYAASGAIAGPMVDFDLRTLIYKDLQLTGATMVPPGTMARVVRLIEQERLKPLLAQTFPLRRLVEAQEAFMAKRHVGNIVVVP